MPFRWLPIRGMFSAWRKKTICEFYWRGVFFCHSRRLLLEDNFDVNLAYQARFFLYISRLKSRRKLPPGKEENGLCLVVQRSDAEWVFLQTIDACRASVTLSKHCLCHYNGAWLAFVSFTLSKHWICNDKSFCTSVCHSQQALLLDIQNQLASVSISLSKHWIWTSKSILPTVCHSVLLLVKHPQTPLVFNNSFASKGEQQ